MLVFADCGAEGKSQTAPRGRDANTSFRPTWL